ncbi:MAG: transposase [Proteobacteria bacterium]|nr:MAG: transposase [Pseudomonadota bacterium]
MKSKSLSKSAGNRRKFTAEFKAEAVRISRDPGQSIAQVAKDLGVADGVLRNWIKQSDADSGVGKSNILTSVEKEELSALRREVKQLRMEREILRKATVFFAKEQM